MTQKRLPILSFALCLTCAPVTSGEEPGLQPANVDLRTEVTVASAENIPIEVMFRVVEGLTGIKIQIAPELVQKWRAEGTDQQFRISAGFDKLEFKYVIAWLAHFGDGKAVVRDGAVRVVPGNGKEQGDPVFDCFNEASGTWRDTLITDINREDREISVQLRDVEVGDVFRMFTRISGEDMIFDPGLLRNSAVMSTRWTGEYKDTTFTNVLDSIAKKAGFVWRLQGGVIFITTNDATAAEQSYDASNKARLSLKGAAIDNLSFLKDAPLTELVLADTKIADISPLKGMPLVHLNLSGTPVTNLSPLTGMTIHILNLSDTPVTDLSALKGMRIDTLDLSRTPLQDLLQVRDILVRGLRFDGTTVSDLRPLEGKDIYSVNFAPGRIKFGIEILWNMKSVKYINNLNPAEFWRRYDAEEFREETTVEPKPDGDGLKSAP